MKPEMFKTGDGDQLTPPEKPSDLKAAFGICLDELKPETRFYAENLRAQILETYKDYGVQNMEEFLSLAKDPKKVPIKKLQEVKKMVDKLNEVLETGEFQSQLEHLREKLKLRLESEFFSAEAIRAFRIVFEGLGEVDASDAQTDILYLVGGSIPEIYGTDFIDYSKDGDLTISTGTNVCSEYGEPREIIPELTRMQRTMDALRAKGYVFEPYESDTPYEFDAHKKVKPADLREELKMLKEVYKKAAVEKSD